MVQWSGEHLTELLGILFTGVVAWSAVISTRLSRRLADAELDPLLTMYLEPQQFQPFFVDLVLKNSGRGPAKQVKFEVVPNINLWQGDDFKLTHLAFIRDGLGFLAPYQEIRTLFGTYSELVKKPISVHISYLKDDIRGQSKHAFAKFILDVSQYDGISSIGEHPHVEAAKALASLARDVNLINKGGSWSNLAVTVKRNYFFSGHVNRQWYKLRRKWRAKSDQTSKRTTSDGMSSRKHQKHRPH